jgi:hypothetical protein
VQFHEQVAGTEAFESTAPSTFGTDESLAVLQFQGGSGEASSHHPSQAERVGVQKNRPQVRVIGVLTAVDLRADLVALDASCLRGALPPVDLRAVCFVRAIANW